MPLLTPLEAEAFSLSLRIGAWSAVLSLPPALLVAWVLARVARVPGGRRGHPRRPLGRPAGAAARGRPGLSRAAGGRGRRGRAAPAGPGGRGLGRRRVRARTGGAAAQATGGRRMSLSVE